MPPAYDPCSQVTLPISSRLGDVADVDVKILTIRNHLRWTLRIMNQQAQQREVDLVKIVAPLLETSRPLLDASTRQYIRQVKSLADLFVLASGDAFVFLAQTGSVSRLCVALALSERSSAARRRSMEA